MVKKRGGGGSARDKEERHREKEASLGAVSCYDVGPEVTSDLAT